MVSVNAAMMVALGVVLLASTGESVKCYECNSHERAECKLKEPPEELKIDCSVHTDGSKYTMCRKIVQSIDFEVNGNPAETRVIRGCGWIDTSYKGKCYQRSGFGGRQEVCSCLTDYCNGARGLLSSAHYWTMALFTGILLFIARTH